MSKNMKESCSFKLEHYKYCLESAKRKGYKFLTLEEYIQNKSKVVRKEKIILMRHDIDHKLSLAMNFAEIEKSLGIQTTYFIRLHADYNPYRLENYKVIKNLTEMDHEVGLYYDAGFARLFNENAEQFFKRDGVIFENIINKKISGISCHEPNNSKNEFTISDKNIAKFGLKYQAYSPIFVKDMKYISDSSARWREGCMCNFIEKETPKLYITTHPIWWHKKSPLENY